MIEVIHKYDKKKNGTVCGKGYKYTDKKDRITCGRCKLLLKYKEKREKK